MTNLKVVSDFSPADEAALKDGLDRHTANVNAPPFEKKKLGAFVRDGEGRIVAGVTGDILWNMLYVDILWVDESMRHKGIGSKLMHAIEEQAVKEGCNASHLWTQSWQGPDFYPKLGYKQFVVNEGMPRGHRRIGFMKQLAA